MATVTMFEVYLEGRKGALMMGAFTVRELERNISEILNERGGAICFKEDQETKTVFFSYAGNHVGFYREAE